MIGSLSACYSVCFLSAIALWPQSSPKWRIDLLKTGHFGPLYSTANLRLFIPAAGDFKNLTTKRKAIRRLPTISLHGRLHRKGVEMLRCTYHIVKEACESNCGNVKEILGEKQAKRKPEAAYHLRHSPPKLWVLIALLFNLSEEYVGAESTTSPSCYFVTTLQNT